ncbi:Thiamine-phosphate synthase [Marinomonas gallaica]|uniref:Thiamine-phosphate synthase n=1 Tax=Marinomonas gallaica TaxID=1806667 RepID=A0A1C3JU19_9GAMM|nr:thiamine phosphate synthase [Marinomonas gallaica]SBT18642.1 Thiamine-phosphate synthase [Marinomonas gallaica]SBT21597.1 Thiamine-phosphate synthase [Marinomonas gallaica]
MHDTEIKTIALTDEGFKSSVLDSTRHLGCRVGHATKDSARIEPTAQGLTLQTQSETWHFVSALSGDNQAYQTICQGSQVTVQLPDQRVAMLEAPKLLKVNRNDLAVALACFIEQGYEHLDAMTLALAWLTQQACAAGAGWPEDRTWFPRTAFENDHQLPTGGQFAPICKEQFTLYPVVDSVAWLALVLEQGVTTAQLRIKDPSDPDLKQKVQQAIALGQEQGAQVFINDYWQLAIELGAYGVHLGQEDIEMADLTAIQQAGVRLGISTHGYFEIMRAFNLKPSYIALGHIFPTVTKDMPSQPQGLTRLGQYVTLIDGAYPTVAIGGISAERLPKVNATGVDSIALVTAITRAEDPKAATQGLLNAVTKEEGDAYAVVCE